MKTTQLLDFGSNILRSKKIISHRIDSEVILSYILKISRENKKLFSEKWDGHPQKEMTKKNIHQ